MGPVQRELHAPTEVFKVPANTSELCHLSRVYAVFGGGARSSSGVVIETPRGAKTSGGIELKIGRVNYLGCLTKGPKLLAKLPPPGVVWAIG